MSMRFLKAALPPSRYRTGTMRWSWRLASVAVVSIPPGDDATATAPCRSRRFAWPSGGTEEFLGRWPASSNSWRTEAKGALIDPPDVFGAVGRAAGNRKDRTSRCRHEGTALVPRGFRFKTVGSQVGNSGVRALTLVSIYVFGGLGAARASGGSFLILREDGHKLLDHLCRSVEASLRRVVLNAENA